MSDELFEGNISAKTRFINSILGEYSEKLEGDAVPDWGDEDEDVDKLMADCPDPDPDLVLTTKPAAEPSTRTFSLDDEGTTCSDDESWREVCRVEPRNRLDELPPALRLRADRLLRKIGASVEASLVVNKQRIKNQYHAKMIFNQVEGNGFASDTYDAYRMSMDRFEIAFNLKYFPENDEMDPALKQFLADLKVFCSKKKLPEPIYVNSGVAGVYTTIVSIGKDTASCDSSRCLLEAECKASQMWLNLHGGNWKQVVHVVEKENVFDEELNNYSPVRRVKAPAIRKQKPSSSSQSKSVFDGALDGEKLREESKKGAKLLSQIQGLKGELGSKTKGRSPRSKLLTKEIFDSSCASIMSDLEPGSPIKQDLLDHMDQLIQDKPNSDVFSEDECNEPCRKSTRTSSRIKIEAKSPGNRIKMEEKSPRSSKTKGKSILDAIMEGSSAKRGRSPVKPSNKKARLKTDIDELLAFDSEVETKESSPSPAKKNSSGFFANFADSDSSGEEEKTPLFSKVLSQTKKSTSTPNKSAKKSFSFNVPQGSKVFKKDVDAEKSKKTSETAKRQSVRQSCIFKYQEYTQRWDANAGDEESSDSENDESNLFSFDPAAKAAYMEKINQEKKDKKKKTQTTAAVVPAPTSPRGSDVFAEEFPEENDLLKQLKEKRKKKRPAKKTVRSKPGSDSTLSEPEDKPTVKSGKRKSKKKLEPDASQARITGFLMSSPSVKEAARKKKEAEVEALLGSPPPSILEETGIIDTNPDFIENMRSLDEKLEALAREKEADLEEMRANAVLRDRIENEINEEVLEKLFNDNLDFLKGIWSGEVESDRHDQYQEDGVERQNLMYRMITFPFTDLQLDWTLKHMSKVWMQTKRERLANNEYVWKVLMPECFIKFYMDFFQLDKEEAEKRIWNTPPKEEDDYDF